MAQCTCAVVLERPNHELYFSANPVARAHCPSSFSAPTGRRPEEQRTPKPVAKVDLVS